MLKRNSISKKKKNYSNKKTIRNLYGGAADAQTFIDIAVERFNKRKAWVDKNPLALIGIGIGLLGAKAGRSAISSHLKRASIERKIKEIRNNPKEFTKLEPILKNDKQFVLEVMKEIPQIWHYIPEKIKNDKDFIKLLERNKDFVVRFIKEIPEVLPYISEKLKNDKNFIKLLEREKITLPNSMEEKTKSDDE